MDTHHQFFPWQDFYMRQQKVEQLKSQVDQLQHENGRLEQEIKRIKELDDENAMLYEGIRSLKQDLLKANEATAAAKQAASQAQRRASDAEQQAAEDRQQAKDAVQQTTQQASLAAQHATALAQQVAEAQQQAAEAQRRADSEVQLREAAQAAKAQADTELQKMKTALVSQLEMASRAVQQEQQKTAAAQQALQAHKHATATNERQIAQLTKQLSERQRQYGEVQGRLREAEQQVARQGQERTAQEARMAAEIQELEVVRQSPASHPSYTELSLKVSQLEEELATCSKREAAVKRINEHLVEEYRKACQAALDEKDKQAVEAEERHEARRQAFQEAMDEKVEEYRKACQAALDEKDKQADERREACQQACLAALAEKDKQVEEHLKACDEAQTKLEVAYQEVKCLMQELEAERAEKSTKETRPDTSMDTDDMTLNLDPAATQPTNLPSSSELSLKVSQLEEELSKARKSEADVTRERDHLIGDVEQEKKEVDKYRSAYQEAHSKLDQSNQEVADLKQQLQLAEEETAHLKQQLQLAAEETAHLKQQLQLAAEETARLTQELDGERKARAIMATRADDADDSTLHLPAAVAAAPVFLPGLPSFVPLSRVLNLTGRKLSGHGSPAGSQQQPHQPQQPDAGGVTAGTGQLQSDPAAAAAAQGLALIPDLLSSLLQRLVYHRERQGTAGKVSSEQAALLQGLQQWPLLPPAAQQALCRLVMQRADLAVEQVRQRGAQQGLQLAFAALMSDSEGTILGMLQQALPAADAATVADVHRAVQLSQLQQFQQLLQQQQNQLLQQPQQQPSHVHLPQAAMAPAVSTR